MKSATVSFLGEHFLHFWPFHDILRDIGSILPQRYAYRVITDPPIHLGAEGVRFSYAETRLWGMRDARNDGQSLRETPEPEDWRVGRVA